MDEKLLAELKKLNKTASEIGTALGGISQQTEAMVDLLGSILEQLRQQRSPQKRSPRGGDPGGGGGGARK